MSNYVAYYRVSTKKQGQSGLGLQAQRDIVKRFLTSQVLAEFVEIETGKSADRPQLASAIDVCKKTNAILIVAKLDRLARNVQFTSTLMNSGVEFLACDIPGANRMTIHVMAALAEEEARLISERTKAALAVAKQQGTRLGRRPGSPPTNAFTVLIDDVQAREQRKLRKATASYKDVLPIVTLLRERGETYASIASILNEKGYTTPRGGQFHASGVHDLVRRVS